MRSFSRSAALRCACAAAGLAVAAGCSSSSTNAGRQVIPTIDTGTPSTSGSTPTPTPSDDASTTSVPTSTGSASASPAPSASTSGSASPSSSASAGGTGACTTAELTVTLGTSGAAAGSQITPIVFANSGKTACRVSGFPGVSFVTGDNGAQVGEPASRNGATHGVQTLQPGQSTQALFQQANAQNYPADACDPVAIRGLRVYPPDQTTAVFLALPSGSTACSTQSQGSGGNQSSVQAVSGVSSS